MNRPSPSSPPTPSRHLGLDLGERRIGVAISEEGGLGPRPLQTIDRQDDAQAVEALARVIDERRIDMVVAGLPLNMDGSQGRQAQRARSLIGRLRKLRPGPRYEFQDERLSSEAADEMMNRLGTPTSKRKGLRDQMAAVVILDEYLRKQAAS